MRRVVITGVGVVGSLGFDQPSLLSALRELRHGFEAVEWLGNPRVATKALGTVKGFRTLSVDWRDWEYPGETRYPAEVMRTLPPHGLYCLVAVDQAVADAGLTKADLSTGETGLFTASAGSPFMLHHHLSQMYKVSGERGSPSGVVSSIAGTLNFNLATYYQIRGAVCGFVSACASSSHGVGYAMDEIRLGRQSRMIVVGSEEVAAETVLPFAAMRALSVNPDPAKASRPFDRKRDGFVATGGAAALIIESLESAQARGATIYAELAGWGQASDGYNVAISHPEGKGLTEAMRRALADASAAPGDIDYVNAHATSTPVGDRSEATALKEVFLKSGASPRISSTKALTGHGLSMAGALETAICALSIRHGFTPGCAHLEEPDPVCEGLNLPRTTETLDVRTVLNNSSGFGGSNVALVLRKFAG